MAPLPCAASLLPVKEKYKEAEEKESSHERKKGGCVLEKANEIVLQVMEVSRLTSDDNITTPRFLPGEIRTGRVLGRGGFGVVKQLREIRLRTSDDDRLSVRGSSSHRWSKRCGNASDIDDNVSREGFGSTTGGSILRWSRKARSKVTVAGSVGLNGTGHSKRSRRLSGNSSICSESVIGGGTINCRIDAFSTAFDLNSREHMARRARIRKGEQYVIKVVDPKLRDVNKTDFLKGIVDLSMEAHFLSSLDHPNIIKLRGMCLALPYESVAQMLILDNLPEIFHQRLNTWMHAYRTTRGLTGFVTRGRRRAKDLLTDRLVVAYDIARALDYVHSKMIVYRDLKPDNIGFDADGKLQLFDFGLAKELPGVDKSGSELYHLTGSTGAIRYMAPEVGLNQPYNRKADVYSWSMLLWYILALEPPLAIFTNSMFVERVFKRGCRPAINGKWSKCIRKILKHSWQTDIHKRLDFQAVLTTLRKEIQVSEFAYDVDDDKLSSSVRTRGTACESTVNEYEQVSRKVPLVITEETESPDYHPTNYLSTAMIEI